MIYTVFRNTSTLDRVRAGNRLHGAAYRFRCTCFRRGTTPNSPRVTSPYPQLGTTSYLCGRYQDHMHEAKAKASTASSRKFRKRGGNDAIQATSDQDVKLHLRGHKCTHLGFQSATLTQGQQIGEESCVAQVRTMTVKNQHNKEAGQQRLGINHRIVTLIHDAGSRKEKDLNGLQKNKSGWHHARRGASRSILSRSLYSLFIGCTEVKDAVCRLLKICPPGVNPELMMECKLIAHPT